jgi:hypothetical protein
VFETAHALAWDHPARSAEGDSPVFQFARSKAREIGAEGNGAARDGKSGTPGGIENRLLAESLSGPEYFDDEHPEAAKPCRTSSSAWF